MTNYKNILFFLFVLPQLTIFYCTRGSLQCCSMPLRKKSGTIPAKLPTKIQKTQFLQVRKQSIKQQISYKISSLDVFVGKNKQFLTFLFLKQSRICFLRKKNTYKNPVLQDFVGIFIISILKNFPQKQYFPQFCRKLLFSKCHVEVL